MLDAVIHQFDWLRDSSELRLATVLRTRIQLTMDLANLPSYLDDDHAERVQDCFLCLLQAMKERLAGLGDA